MEREGRREGDRKRKRGRGRGRRRRRGRGREGGRKGVGGGKERKSVLFRG